MIDPEQVFEKVNIILAKCDIGAEISKSDFKPACIECGYVVEGSRMYYRCATLLCPARRLNVNDIRILSNIVNTTKQSFIGNKNGNNN